MSIKKTKLALSVVLVSGVAALTGFGSLALFTDTQAVTGNIFASGSVELSTNPVTDLVSFSEMMPGDVVTDSIVVTNDTGGEAFRYSISSVADNTDTKGLRDQLVLVVKTVDATVPATPCDNFDGTQLYTGDLDSSAGKIVGDVATGSQTGDRVLTAGLSETLCFRVSLPTGTGNAFQNADTTAVFTFDAEQTTNNP